MDKRYFTDDKGKPSLGRKLTWYSYLLSVAVCVVGTIALWVAPSQAAIIVTAGCGLAGIAAGGKAVSKIAETRHYEP